MCFCRKVERIVLLHFPDGSNRTCANSIAGGSDLPTTAVIVASRRRLMLVGENGHYDMTFLSLTNRANKSRMLACGDNFDVSENGSY